jgi:hypothetical protein
MSNARRTQSPNSDLVTAARAHSKRILIFHDQLKDAHPIVVLDFQRMRLHSYPFSEYKATIRPESQAMLNEEYEKTVAKNKVLVVVWDSETRRLATTRIRRR